MGSNTSGFQNETDLISALSNKLYAELNDNLKKFISFLFPQVNNNDKIKCYSGIVGQKPDIIIEINNKRKNVSIKKGSGNSVHQEDIDLFMEFLTTLDISEEAKIELLKYHWADGTTDGSGKIRVSSAEYKAEHQKEIDLINSELNKREPLTKLITRVLFKGKSDKFDGADVVYYGTINEGHWATKDEIIKYMLNNKFAINSIHFGPLTYQIWNRCLNFNPNTENRRNVMQVKWGSLERDLLIIEKERVENE